MADLTTHAKVFATPVHGDAAGVVRTLATARLEATRRRLIKALVADGHELAATALGAFRAGNDTAWRPELGLALLAHRTGANALAALQLAVTCAGMAGNGALELAIDPAAWLYLDGWLLPVQGGCQVAADGHAITIESALGAARFTRTGHRWCPDAALAGPWHAHASGGLAPRYITASGLRHHVEGFPWIAGPPPAAAAAITPVEARLARIHQGWQLIIEHAAQFGAWVAATAAGLLLLEPSGTHEAQSGSSYDHPGLIAFEPPDSPAYCGELLVHECAHQHMLVYTMAVPLVTPGSQETYFSPIKRADRTVDRVLSGAHAVGNMILYYEALRQAIPLDTDSAQRLAQHKRWFAEDYRPALDASTTLTDAGRQFWRSLCEPIDRAAAS